MVSALTGWHLLILLVALLPLLLALVSIVRSPRLSTGYKVLWIVIVFVFPFLGPLVWFLFGRTMNPGPSTRA
ncbi:PLD nuclease N-terminal domain-containing protein [Microbacterium sp. 1P10UB]|uniref:PLD nuclease N-terminal domain-containing protein n=1 Tax=unclassified Microbacterium TaxID=2609290 RepID=UPI0039A3EEFE